MVQLAGDDDDITTPVERQLNEALELLDLPGCRVEEIRAGNYGNGNWHLWTASGRRAVLRRYHLGASADSVAYEHTVLQHLDAAGWDVPHPLSEPLEVGGRWFCLTRYIGGGERRPETAAEEDQRGRDLARLNLAMRPLVEIVGQRPGYQPQHTGLTVHTDLDWDALLEAFATDRPDVAEWAASAAELAMQGLDEIGAGELPTTVIHGDFAAWNVHYDVDGSLAGVIDFGLSHLDSRPYELAIARSYRAPHFRAAYIAELERIGWPMSPLELASIDAIDLAFRVDMVAWSLHCGVRSGAYDLEMIERQLSKSGVPDPRSSD